MLPIELEKFIRSGKIESHYYSNDTCHKYAINPQYHNDHDSGVYVFVESENIEERENQNGPRFVIAYINHNNGVYFNIMETDNISDVIEYISRDVQYIPSEDVVNLFKEGITVYAHFLRTTDYIEIQITTDNGYTARGVENMVERKNVKFFLK